MFYLGQYDGGNTTGIGISSDNGYELFCRILCHGGSLNKMWLVRGLSVIYKLRILCIIYTNWMLQCLIRRTFRLPTLLAQRAGRFDGDGDS